MDRARRAPCSAPPATPSPEQAKGGALDGQADVYSLALVLVEAVTGQVPFPADTTIGTLMARIDTPLSAPAELGPLGPVIEAAGRNDPADRIDAGEMAKQLDAVVRSLPDPAPIPLAGPPGEDAAGDLTEIRSRSRLYDREADDSGEHTGFEQLGATVPAKAGRRRRAGPSCWAC